MNFVDRGLLAVVGPELVPELGISDTQFGLLTGFGFALLYTIVGIPLARYADAAHRVWIMTVCVALWSLMTSAMWARNRNHHRLDHNWCVLGFVNVSRRCRYWRGRLYTSGQLVDRRLLCAA